MTLYRTRFLGVKMITASNKANSRRKQVITEFSLKFSIYNIKIDTQDISLVKSKFMHVRSTSTILKISRSTFRLIIQCGMLTIILAI